MLGAYAVVLAVNAYVYTSLSYVTLNILKRLLNNNFSPAFTDVPFQTIGESPPPAAAAVLTPPANASRLPPSLPQTSP